jgi:hypothetical protein
VTALALVLSLAVLQAPGDLGEAGAPPDGSAGRAETRDGGAASGRSPDGGPAEADAEVMENLDLLEQLELLERLDVFDPDAPAQARGAPPAR